jgi:2-methylcitrate dehydratase
MSHYDLTSALRPEPDALLQQIADYVFDLDKVSGDDAINTARLCLMDTLGCGLLALNYPACVKLLGPIVPGATMVVAHGFPALLTNWTRPGPLSI